jgi:hypothetical protein
VSAALAATVPKVVRVILTPHGMPRDMPTSFGHEQEMVWLLENLPGERKTGAEVRALGAQFKRALRDSRPRLATMQEPILLLSAYSGKDDRSKMLQAVRIDTPDATSGAASHYLEMFQGRLL